jgi:spermidine/putrescine transport system substrate-binding protein
VKPETRRTMGPHLTRRQTIQGMVGTGAMFSGLVALGSAAQAASSVNALVWEGYENPEAFKGLAEIAINAAYLAANEDTITKTATPGAFDLLTIYQGMIDPLRKSNRIEPIDESKLPNLADLFPLFGDMAAFKRDGQRFAVPYTWGAMMTLYDSEKTDEPKSFADLMSPKLKGKIGMPDDAYAVITTFARYAGFDDANTLTKAQLEQVMGLLKKFKPQILSIAPSYGELPAMYQRGEILVSVPDWTPTMIGASAGGRNIKSTIVAEGGFSFVDCWMRVIGAEHVDEAYRVMNHAIGSEAQQVIAVSTGLGIVNKKAVAALAPEVAAPWSYDQVDKVFSRAPLYAGAPIEAAGDVTTYQDWVAAWTDFKAS